MKKNIFSLVLILNTIFYTKPMNENEEAERLQKACENNHYLRFSAAAVNLTENPVDGSQQSSSYPDLKELLLLCTNTFVTECHDEKHAENFLSTIQCFFQARNGISFPVESEETISSSSRSFVTIFAEKCCEFNDRLVSSEEQEAILSLYKEFLAISEDDPSCHNALSWLVRKEHLSDYEHLFLINFAFECACLHTAEISDSRIIKQTISQTITFITAIVTESIFKEYKFLPLSSQQEITELEQSILERKNAIEREGNIPTFFDVIGDDGIRYMIDVIERFFLHKYELPMPTTWDPDKFYLRVCQLTKDFDIKEDFDIDKELDSCSFRTRTGNTLHLNLTTTFALRAFLKEIKSLVKLFICSNLMEKTSCKQAEKIIERAVVIAYQEGPMKFTIDTKTSLINAKKFVNRLKPYKKYK